MGDGPQTGLGACFSDGVIVYPATCERAKRRGEPEVTRQHRPDIQRSGESDTAVKLLIFKVKEGCVMDCQEICTCNLNN